MIYNNDFVDEKKNVIVNHDKILKVVIIRNFFFFSLISFIKL